MLLVVRGCRREEPSIRKRYTVVLSEPERARLHTLIGQGAGPARALTHARILLKANQGEAGPGWTDQVIADALEVPPPPLPGCASTTPPPGWMPRCTPSHPSVNTAASLTVSRRAAWSR